MSGLDHMVKIKWLVDIQDIEGYEGNWYGADDFEANGGDIEIVKTNNWYDADDFEANGGDIEIIKTKES